MLRRILITIVALAAALATTTQAQEQGESPVAQTSARINANGVELHYEIHGEGDPLIMLHGGVNPSEMFGVPLTAMAEDYQVYAVHLRGHGLSADKDEGWSYEVMADDVDALMEALGLERAKVMGYSLGAGVALQLAIRHPERVEKLVVVATAFSSQGDYPEIRAAFEAMPGAAAAIGQQIAGSPLGELYPDVDWERVMRKTGEMNRGDHDWSEGVAAIRAPTLLIFADADSIQLEHIVQFYKLLGGGRQDGGMDGSGRSVNQLAIVPNRTHYDLLGAPVVTMFAKDFLES